MTEDEIMARAIHAEKQRLLAIGCTPAFPRAATEYDTWGHSGMTLRDYFAGQALMRMVDSTGYPVGIAEYAYIIADAMLAARSAGEGK